MSASVQDAPRCQHMAMLHILLAGARRGLLVMVQLIHEHAGMHAVTQHGSARCTHGLAVTGKALSNVIGRVTVDARSPCCCQLPLTNCRPLLGSP